MGQIAMNIECDKCKTRFRFDDALMEGPGIWLRCSRCQNEFFFKNPEQPFRDDSTVPPPAADGLRLQGDAVFDEQILKEGPSPSADGMPGGLKFEDTVQIAPPAGLHDRPVVSPEPSILDEIEKEVTAGDSKETSKEDRHPFDEDEDEDEDEERDAGRGKKEGRFTWKLVALIMIINLLIGGGVYLFFFPEIGDQALNGIRSIPVVQYIFGVEKQPGDVNAGLIKIKNITNRYVNSYFTDGVPLLVVEGIAVNKSQEILTRIRIQGKLYDGTNRILQMRMSYCGNALTDQELVSLQEGEIQRRLSMLQDANISKDRVLPNREIPFMLVFALDKAGVDKRSPVVAGAIPVSAERLLN
jgi:predicted Zn finger-like uncharacterized protein